MKMIKFFFWLLSSCLIILNKYKLYSLLVILCIFHGTQSLNYKLTSIYYGNQGWSMNELQYFSSWTDKKPVTVLLFTDWCNTSMLNLFNIQLNNIWNNGSIPIITWEMFECGGISSPGIIERIANSVYDNYINHFGDRLKVWLAGNDGLLTNSDDRRAYLRLAHEMNGNWYPWSLNSTPQDYISSWRHIHDIFTQKGLNSKVLQWIWCVNNVDVGQYVAENYWVGDNYADWLGIDGYNFGASQVWSNWLWPNQVFDHMISRLRQLSTRKPICINEYASTSIQLNNISDIQGKTNWLIAFCSLLDTHQITMASYFNEDKETDWAIFNGIHGNNLWNNVNVYTAYADCLNSSTWITSNLSDPKRITDDQFAGIMNPLTLSSTSQKTIDSRSIIFLLLLCYTFLCMT